MQASDIARRLNQAWVGYMDEFLAQVDAGCDGLTLSERCGWFSDVRRVLGAAVSGDYAPVPDAVRHSVLHVPDHVRDVHPEYWHLFFEPPGPAALALRDQVDACRAEATQRFGRKPTGDDPGNTGDG